MRRKKTLDERQAEMRSRHTKKHALVDHEAELVRHAQAKVVGFLLYKKGRPAGVIAGHLKRLFGLDIDIELVEEWIAKGCPLSPTRGVGSSPSFPAA